MEFTNDTDGGATFENDLDQTYKIVNTQYDKKVGYRAVHHANNLCHEYIVRTPDFSYRHWLIWTAIFYIFSYLLQLHLQVLP